MEIIKFTGKSYDRLKVPSAIYLLTALEADSADQGGLFSSRVYLSAVFFKT